MKPLLALISFVLLSCATNPAMDKFVARKIDRPFVQADGISSFSAIGNGSYTKDVVGRESVKYPIPLPIYYSFTLFENVAVEGAGIPIAIDWQIENSPAGYWGLTQGEEAVGMTKAAIHDLCGTGLPKSSYA